MLNRSEVLLRTCFHCGNSGLMDIICKHSHTFGGPITDPLGNEVGWDFQETFDWHLLCCPVCKKVTLIESYTCQEFEGYYQESYLFPQSKINYDGVPQNVKSAFEAALKVRNIDPNIYCLSLRRVLEAICKDKGAKGNDLFHMCEDLIKRNILPDIFDDACWIVRELGNFAAHADKRNFSEKEIEQSTLCVKNIINNLYVHPYQVKRIRASIEAEKKTVSSK